VIKASLDAEGRIRYKRTLKINLFHQKKMLNQNVSFDEVYDKFALRIVYKANHDENFWLGKYILL
jgi:GTP pyrophosphokinase